MKALFKPVINTNIPVARESIFTKGNPITQSNIGLKELSTKLD